MIFDCLERCLEIELEKWYNFNFEWKKVEDLFLEVRKFY